MTNPSMRHLSCLTVVVRRNERPVGDRFTLRDARPIRDRRGHEPIITCESADSSARPNRWTRHGHDPGARPVPILPTLQEPADLRGLTEVQLDAARRRDPRDDHRDRRRDRRPPRLLARRRRAHDRAPPAARVAARPDRLGHRPPGLPAQAADRPARAVRHAAPARRRRRLPAAHRVARTTCSTAATPGTGLSIAEGLADGARPAPRARADRGRRRRRGAHERPRPRGAQRHRPPPDASC